jgi:geranylgeranyl diphosphate synthase type II
VVQAVRGLFDAVPEARSNDKNLEILPATRTQTLYDKDRKAYDDAVIGFFKSYLPATARAPHPGETARPPSRTDFPQRPVQRARVPCAGRRGVRRSAPRDRLAARVPGPEAAMDRCGAGATPSARGDFSAAASRGGAVRGPFGGKRLRPILAIAVGSVFGADERDVLPAACAIEMVHTSSLLLDDLPCMDDATLRRGRLVCHRAYGESTAILAAVALLNRAFGIVSEEAEAGTARGPARAAHRRAARRIDRRGGRHRRPVRGSGIDGAASFRSRRWSSCTVTRRGASSSPSAEIGALIGGARKAGMESIGVYAKNLGLAFQVTDDLLDATGTPRGHRQGRRARSRQDDVRELRGRGRGAPAGRRAHRRVDRGARPFGRKGRRLGELAELVRSRDR